MLKIFFILIAFFASISLFLLVNGHSSQLDKFGVLKIYPTAHSGREWYINMKNPDSGIFDPQIKLTALQDKSLQAGNLTDKENHIRMNVGTPRNTEEWKNIEITGYINVISSSSDEGVIVWYARGGYHNNDDPCDGTALKGFLYINGTVGWQKEIWHTGGYTDKKGIAKATDSIISRWIGYKVVIYNIHNNTAVKMETHIDKSNNNIWTKVSELVDDGGWFAANTKKVFDSAKCDRSQDHIILDSGPIVTFRSDYVVWKLKNLSVREIEASEIN